MAEQAVFALVVGERDAAIFAQNRSAAAPAQRKPGIAAPVDQHQRLRSGRQARGQLAAQPLGNLSGAVRLAKILAQVHDLDARHGAILDARVEAQQLVFSGARVMEAFERGRRRCQQRHRAFPLRANHRDVAAVVARRFLLLVAGLLLFVHDDQADIFERREDRRARAHHHARFAIAHAPPFPRALGIRQSAVQDRDAFAKSRPAKPRGPERQADLRHQQQRRAAARERGLDGAQVDLRLAAAGDAVEQPGDEFAGIEPAAEFHRPRAAAPR